MDTSCCILMLSTWDPMVVSFSCENNSEKSVSDVHVCLDQAWLFHFHLSEKSNPLSWNPSWLLAFLFKRLHRCYKHRFSPRHSSQSRECSLSFVVFVTPLTSYFKPDLSAWKSWGQTPNCICKDVASHLPLTHVKHWALSNSLLPQLCVFACFHMGVCAACTVCTVQLCVSAAHV